MARQEYHTRIRHLLQAAETDEQLLELLCVALFLLQERPLEQLQMSDPPIKLTTLRFALYSKQPLYTAFTIPKANGSQRQILAPKPVLKYIQRLSLEALSTVFQARGAAHGFTRARSIATNAQPHVGKRFVLNLDIKDFFPNTHFGRVQAVLKLKPFQCSAYTAQRLATLACNKGALPQGAPTSPFLTNVVCQRLDRKLVQLGKERGFYYTRYADDLSFSSDKAAFKPGLIERIAEIVAEEGYELNASKQRLQEPHQRQSVTGLVVNERLNVPREFLRSTRAMLHNWETQGYDAAERTMRQHSTEQPDLEDKPELADVLAGRIDFIGMVRGHEDPKYQALFQQYQRLLKSTH